MKDQKYNTKNIWAFEFNRVENSIGFGLVSTTSIINPIEKREFQSSS